MLCTCAGSGRGDGVDMLPSRLNTRRGGGGGALCLAVINAEHVGREVGAVLLRVSAAWGGRGKVRMPISR